LYYSLWSAIRIIANGSAIILIALQRIGTVLGAIITPEGRYSFTGILLLNLYYSLWSAIRIIANGGAIILIALQRIGTVLGAIIHSRGEVQFYRNFTTQCTTT
jgi:hypothetical protein